MTRDYKHRRRRSKKSSGSGGPFAKGLGLGLAVALLVHLYHMGQDRKADKEAPPPKRSAVTAPDVAADSGPEYDFYEILPEFEVVIPGQSGRTIEVISCVRVQKRCFRIGVRFVE